MRNTVLISLVLIVLSLGLPFLDRANRYENRVEVWETALKAAMEKPVFGWGFGNTERALHEASLELNNSLRSYTVDSAHNIFLDYLVQGGILGLIILCFLLITTLQKMINKDQKFELVLLLGLLTVMMFNPVSVVNLIQFWWLIGTSSQAIKN